MPVQHRQQHRQTLRIEADREPARISVRRIHQRLNLHQQRTRTFLRHQHAGPGHFLPMLRQEHGRRVAHPLQPGFGHGKHAQFIDRTEAILHRPHQTEAGMGVALEIKHGIDHVFEHARPGQRAFLGHVTDQDHRDAGLFGQSRQLRRTFAHLRHRSRRARQLIRPQRLDRIDHRHLRLFRLQGRQNAFQVDLRHQRQVCHIKIQAAGTQGHLLAGFLTGHVEHTLCLRQMRQRLQQQGALADAGIATDQHHPAPHQTAPQRPIEFTDAGRNPVRLTRFDLGQILQARRRCQRLETMLARRLRHAFHQRVPGIAAGTLALPFGIGRAAFGAGIDGFGFGHGLRFFTFQVGLIVLLLVSGLRAGFWVVGWFPRCGASYFFLLRQEKVSKKKATPGRWPLRGFPALLGLGGGGANSGLRPSNMLALHPPSPALLGTSHGER